MFLKFQGMKKIEILILGGGLSGISTSFHAGHERCLILEKNNYLLGHIASKKARGFTWDEGPHVSFTKSPYIKSIFEKAVNEEFFEFEAKISNYYKGSWIDHPAQVNLHQVSEPLRSKCVTSFLKQSEDEINDAPNSYYDWLVKSFGNEFTNTFANVYTKKYWTLHAKEMGTDWLGSRIYRPSQLDFLEGSRHKIDKQTHYFKKFRYPKSGGFEKYASLLEKNSNFNLEEEVYEIDLSKKTVKTKTGETYTYNTLINTMPLPIFLNRCLQTKEKLSEEINLLDCSKLFLINIEVPAPRKRSDNWIYVYDENLLSTRINFIESLSINNTPEGYSGIQVEVYINGKNKLESTKSELGSLILDEMVTMGLIDAKILPDCKYSIVEVPWANVIFNLTTKQSLEKIWNELTQWGLVREAQDTNPISDWEKEKKQKTLGSLIMNGRFGQWKYFWTDDCILRGKQIGDII